LVINVQGEA